MINEVAGGVDSDRTGSEATPAASFLKGYKSSTRTYIVELAEDSFQLIAQALYILKASEPENKLLDLTLTELNNQTNCVMLAGKDHKVYENILESPILARSVKEVAYIPFERSDYTK